MDFNNKCIRYVISYYIDTSSLNYLAAHVEFALKACAEMCDGVVQGGRWYDELGIQIAGLDYRRRNSVDLSARERSLDVHGDYYKLLSERNRIYACLYLRFLLVFS